LRRQIDSLGVIVHEHAGVAHFADQHTVETGDGQRLQAKKIIICTGGMSRRLSVPGMDLASTHSDAWDLTSVPSSMLVIGAGATGVQIASIFNAFGSRIQLFQTGPRILPSEDDDVSAAVAAAFRESGIVVHENLGAVESFEKTQDGVRMIFSRNGNRASAEATLAVLAIGWVADTGGLRLATAGVETNHRGFVQVDEYLRTSTPHIFAAGDITGRQMLVPQAIQEGFVAATNAVRGPTMTIGDPVSPIGSFTDPEYAQVGLTEAKARETHDVVTAVVRFDSTTRTIIDGRTVGFCKMIVDRTTSRILGCHVVGERAVEITQLAAIAIAARMRVNDLAHIPLSFPTYAGVMAHVAARATRELNLEASWQAHQVESAWHQF
jgi:pyruvate/2-oxoglutarate dehydrogenase complex dihydrolipoamide dehydrogenase (E3) component